MSEKHLTYAPAATLSEETNAERLAALFEAHHARLYRLARRLTANSEDALDLVQETFLKAAKCPRSIPGDAPGEEAWLVRVLINIRRDQWRKSAVRDRHQRSEPRREDKSFVAGDSESALIARQAVWQALDILPPRRRAIVVMHELDDQSVREIADLLGISPITVRWHLSLGRRRLATRLKACVGDRHENR